MPLHVISRFLKKRLITIAPAGPVGNTWLSVFFRMRYDYATRLIFNFVGSTTGIIIDVGGGLGYLLKWLEGAHICYDLYLNVDINLNSLKSSYAHERVLANACHLPLKDSCAELVIAGEVLEHLQDYQRACKEIFRIAKGCVVISYPDERLKNALGFRYPEHVSDVDASTIIRLAGAKFRLCHMKELYFMISFAILDKLKIPLTTLSLKLIMTIQEILARSFLKKLAFIREVFLVMNKRR